MDIIQSGTVNCRNTMNKYLMNQNAGYRLRLPISFLIAIVVSIFMKGAGSINNFFIAHILIPIATFLIVWFAIDIGVRNNISKDKLNMMENKCNKVLNQNNNRLNLKIPDNREFFTSTVEEEDPMQEEKESVKAEMVHNIDTFVSTDDHHLKTHSENEVKKAQNDNIIQTRVSSAVESNKHATVNTNYLNPTKRYYASLPLGDTYPPPLSFTSTPGQDMASGCLLGTNSCSPLCSGTGKNICNLVVPVPGPQWQVQNASTVQYRLNNNMYVPNSCPLGGTVLRDAPDCKNLTNENMGNCGQTNVKCQNIRMYA